MNYAMLLARGRRYAEPAAPSLLPSLNLLGTLPAVGQISISGDGLRIAVSNLSESVSNEQSGAVRGYERIGNSLVQVGETLEGSQAFARLGSSVALNSDGSTIAVGSANFSEGRFEVFDLVSGSWSLRGGVVEPPYAGYRFGDKIATDASGDIVVVGSPAASSFAGDDSRVFVYEWSGSEWGLSQNLGGLGFPVVAVSHSGNVVVVGRSSFGFAGDASSGMVAVYVRDGSFPGFSVTGGTGDYIGGYIAVSGSGNSIAFSTDKEGQRGIVVYDFVSGGWQQRPNPIVTGNTSVRGVAASSDLSKIAVRLLNGSIESYIWSGSSWAKRFQAVASLVTTERISMDWSGSVLVDGATGNVYTV